MSFQAAHQFAAFHMMLDVLGEDKVDLDTTIPLPNINSKVLSKIVEWAVQKCEPDTPPIWNQEFIQVDPDLVLEIISAANLLDCRQLFDLGCNYLADLIKGKTVLEISQMFKLSEGQDSGPQDSNLERLVSTCLTIML